MSIASEISRIQTAKADIKSAIEGKGVTVSSSAKLSDYAALVSAISTGITPSGSINITGNGTVDVTNYAQAIVNVKADVQVQTVTIASAVTAGNATLLSGNSFIKANYANDNFFCGFILVDTSGDISGSYLTGGIAANFYTHLNRYFLTFGGSGKSLKTWSVAGVAYKASANYAGTGYGHIHADSSGNLVAHAPSSYTIKAGKYAVFYGVAG